MKIPCKEHDRLTAPALLDALKAQLDARSGLGNIVVGTGPLGDETPPEAIVFAGVTGDQEWMTLGNRSREDRYQIASGTWVSRPGAGETVIKTARDRPAVILAEVETGLREDATDGRSRSCR